MACTNEGDLGQQGKDKQQGLGMDGGVGTDAKVFTVDPNKRGFI